MQRITRFAFVLALGITVMVVGGADAAGNTPWQPQPPLTAGADGKAFDALGWSVAASGDTVIVGAKTDDVAMYRNGAAYVFVRHGTTWTRQARLVASDAAARDLFGSAVAISGNTAIVGALGRNSNLGQAYIFVRNGTTWTEQAIVKADVSALGDLCGYSVAISGDTAILGCRNNGDGAAHVFVRSGGVWTRQAKLANSESGDYFAFSLGLSGNTAIVGALADKAGGPQGKGSATVFVRNGTTWSVQQKLLAPDGASFDRFGYSVAISGTTAIVGSNNAGARQAAYVFVRNGTAWSQQAKLVADDLSAGDGFGQSVAIAGNTAVIGAVDDDLGVTTGTNEGSAYRFERSGTTWSQQQKLTASDAVNNATFGFAVAATETMAVVGAPARKVGTNGTQGQVYLFVDADSDGDGLPDEWEKNGVTIDGITIDLEAMGADPRHKDVFVHADWMEQDAVFPFHNVYPEPRVIKLVVDAFAIAPVANPDGKPGIRLHVDLGPDSPMNPLTGAKWGALSRAHAVPFQHALGGANAAGTAYDWTAFDAIKAQYFTPAKRASVFRYAVFCDTVAGLTNSGLARDIPGTDFMLAFGVRELTGPSNRVLVPKASTFMHELGHSLGLGHGGGDSINDKPNYLSLMNYAFQLEGILQRPDGKQRRLDYSRAALPTLDETNLVEADGIMDPALHPTLWNPLSLLDFPPGTNKCRLDLAHYFEHFLPGPALDWDCNGVVNASATAADVNGDAICVSPGDDGVLYSDPAAGDVLVNGRIMAGPDRQCDTVKYDLDRQTNPVGYVAPTTLAGFDDWPALDYRGGDRLGGLGAGASDSMITPIDEIPSEQLAERVPAPLLDAAESAPLDVVTLSTQHGGAPLTVQFDGSGSQATSGTIAGWAWDFGDGSSGSGATPTHTYDTPGEYFASVTVTDSSGRVNLVPLLSLVVVTDEPPATPTPTSTPTRTPTFTATPAASSTPASTANPGPTATSAATVIPPPTATSVPTPLPTSPPALSIGDADPSFNASVTTRDGEVIHAIVTQSDGKVIVGGRFESYGGYARHNIARVNPDGSCDPTFDPGLVLTHVIKTFPASEVAIRSSLEVYAVALQVDGKVLVGVQATRGFVDGIATTSRMLFRLDTDGTLDASFAATGFEYFEPRVTAIVVQPNGKIVVGGAFLYGPGGRHVSIARLNIDGSFDPSFTLPPSTFYDGPTINAGTQGGSVSALALQPDGKLIIGGFFTSVGPVSKAIMARLNADGSLDPSFNVGNATGFNIAATPWAFAFQPGGKILVAGNLFNESDGKTLPLVRLAADGSRDPSFSLAFDSAGFGSNAAAYALATQTDGKIILAGLFQSSTPPTRQHVARLNADGTLDATFDTGSGMSGYRRHATVAAVALQANGKVVVAGNFDTFKGEFVEGIVQLEPDGSRDQTFDSNGAGQNGRVTSVLRQPDGKLLVGFYGDGQVMKVNATRRGGLGRIDADGTTDDTFVSPFDLGSTVVRTMLQADGKILVIGDLRLLGETRELAGVPRLNADGTLDPTFLVVATPLAIQPDGKILASAGIPYSRATELVRLNPDGTRDETFTPHFFPNGGADMLVLQPDGGMVISGLFYFPDGREARVARLGADGSFDPTFDPGTGPDDYVRALLLQPDGKILIAGKFSRYDGTVRRRIARIDTDGSLDTAFDPFNPNGRNVGTLALQPDGKIVVGIQHNDNDSTLSPVRVYRLESDGQFDPSFPITGTGIEPFNGAVNALVIQPDGDIVIGGAFDVVNGVAHLALARLFGATPTPAAALDPFLFSKVKTAKGAPKLAALGPVTLADALTTSDVDVQKIAALGLAVDVDAAGVADARTQLADYVLKMRKGGRKFLPLRDVRVQNPCGDLVVTVAKPEHLLVPAHVDLQGPVLPPDAASHEVADFRCYKVKLQKKRGDGTPLPRFPKGAQVEVGDPREARRYDLKKLTRLCYPVAESGTPLVLKTGEPFPFTPAALRHETVHLACYRVKPAKVTIAQTSCRPIDAKDKGTKIVPTPPKRQGQRDLRLNSRLGAATLDTAKELELCIPSTVDPR